MQLFSDYCVYLAVRLVICLLQMLPPRWCEWGVEPLAFLAADCLRIRRQVVKENLHRAFPSWSAEQRRHVTRQMWRHLLLMVVEIALAHRKLHLHNWEERLNIRQAKDLLGHMFSGRPVVFVSGHLGNFELSTQLLGLLGFHGYAVARPLDNRFLNAFLLKFRGQFGQKILPKQGSSDEIEEMLSRGGTLCVLGDQNAGRKGIKTEFFGETASTHKAIALFALQHDALLLVISTCRRAGLLDYEVVLEDAIDVREVAEHADPIKELTQRFTSGIERSIRRRPEQYWWVHRRWK